MGLELKLTPKIYSIKLGDTVEVQYQCSGAYDCSLQADNMPEPRRFGTGEVSGIIKLLPVVSGDFYVVLTAYGVVHQNKGIDQFSETETNSIKTIISVE